MNQVYQNERNIPFKGWGDFLLPIDPDSYSDKKGKKKLKMKDFREPEGWKWNKEWYIDPDIPELDIYGDQDNVVIEVFENERKQPLKGYCKILLPMDPKPFSDRAGTIERKMESVELPPGWKWSTKWQVDMNRAVDKDGWEYAVAFNGDFHPSSRPVDFVRRRRWFIERVKDPKAPPEIFTEGAQDNGEGWLYSTDFFGGFHLERSPIDSVRRRRWHRELIPRDPESKISLAEIPMDCNAAGTFVAFKSSFKYEFRAHLYQGNRKFKLFKI